MIDDFCDLFRTQFSFVYVLVVIPVALTAIAPQKTGIMQEFKAFRLQHFDLAGNQKGSRAWRVSFDGTSLSASVLRRCMMVSWQSLANSLSNLHDLLQPTLGAALIVIPSDLKDLTESEREAFLTFEERLMEKPFNFAVYLVPETSEINYILRNIEQQKKQEHGTAVAALVSLVTANSYHFVSEKQLSNVALSNPVYNIIGKLSTFDRNDKVPTILLVAHYDSFGAAPGLSYGSDSNGSGLVALLELLRLFSQLYQNSATRAKYNLVFLLSAAGKVNYMGTRQWIDDYIELTESSNAPTSKLEFAICLDALLGQGAGTIGRNSGLHVHVSKIPRNGSNVDKFYARFQSASHKQNQSTGMISKKINLADDYLAWEHERFSIRKLYAFTISGQQTARSRTRRSLLDLHEPSNVEKLSNDIKILAEALMNHIFHMPLDIEHQFFDQLQVDKESVGSWYTYVSNVARAQQLFADPPAKDSLLNDLFSYVDHYTQETHFVPVKLDKRDPEFVLYGATEDTIYAYRVKPAVFDLILALLIAAYMSMVYLFILNASVLQYKIRSLVVDLVKKHV